MSKLLSFVGSMKSMSVLMLIFAVAIGYATIVENDFGIMTAKAEIYNARWFEILLALLAVNLVYNIHKYKMYTLKKAPVFLFHIGFLVVLFGATVTRYIGYEGNMHIREGMTSSSIVSARSYFLVNASLRDSKASYEEPIYLSKRDDNSAETTLDVNGKSVKVELMEYIPDAVESLVADKNGHPIIKMMITGGDRGKPVALDMGKYYDAGNFIIDFSSGMKFDKPSIRVYLDDGKLYMQHDMKLSYLRMADKSQGNLEASKKEILNQRVLYRTDLGGFVLREFMPKASKKIVTNGNSRMNSSGVDALRFKVSVDDKSKELLVYGRKGVVGEEKSIVVDGVHVGIAYGSKNITIPFKIKLLDFQLDRYPGSMSPASYASEVVLIDESKGVHMPFRIFMNHILDYGSFRFFQASYDRDEKGTVLSVNNDPGTVPTYIGYFLLALGMYWSLFSKKGRFAKLSEKAKKASAQKLLPIVIAVGVILGNIPSQAEELNPAVKTILSFDKSHAEKFGGLIVQDTNGRMKPMDTLSTEILAKLHSSATLKVGKSSLSANQVILGMMIRPDIFRDVKLIKTRDPLINDAIGAKRDAKYVSFSQFFETPNEMSGYKLGKLAEEASRKEPKFRNKLDKAVLKVHERVK